MKRKQFGRRELLRAAGSTLALPFFLKQAFADVSPRAPNLVLLMQSNGTNQKNYWPADGTFDSPILHELLSDQALAKKTTLLKNVNFDSTGMPTGNGHDWGFHGLYSGYAALNNGPDQFGGGISLDHLVAQTVELGRPIDKLHCGVHAVDYKIINAGRASFSALGPRQQVPCELDLYALYTKVFGAPTADTPEARAAAAQRIVQKRSVLDSVAGDLQALQGRLGPTERQKVDIHLTAVRDFENRLSATIPAPTGACAMVKPSRIDVPSDGQGNEANAEPLLRLFMEFIANAVACDMVGCLSFQFGRGGDHFHYRWLDIPGMPEDAHDLVAHLDDGNNPDVARINTAIKVWYTTLVTDLARRLDAFPQADGTTALDNSLVVWGNEIATGTHAMENLPLALLGKAGGRLKKTGYIVDAGAQPHHRLGATVLNIMGNPVAGFGNLPNCGMLNGLELDLQT